MFGYIFGGFGPPYLLITKLYVSETGLPLCYGSHFNLLAFVFSVPSKKALEKGL